MRGQIILWSVPASRFLLIIISTNVPTRIGQPLGADADVGPEKAAAEAANRECDRQRKRTPKSLF